MRIRKQGNRQWLDRAYEYVANNGASTASQLRDALFMNPNTGRPYAYNPTRNSTAMLLKMDKRFIGTIVRVGRTDTNEGQYDVNIYDIERDLL